MKNFTIEALEKRVKIVGICEKYGAFNPNTFTTTHALRSEVQNGAFSWWMLSEDRTTIYASKETATECKRKDVVLSFEIEEIDAEKGKAVFKKRHINISKDRRDDVKRIVEILITRQE